jgi:hypothetical protein
MEFFLLFNEMPVHALILFFGLVFGRRSIFFGAWAGYLAAIFFLQSLKAIFAEPLIYNVTNQKFGQLGHTDASLVLYGWLFLYYKRYFLRAFLVFISLGLSGAGVYFNFYTWADILGSWFFAILYLIPFYFWVRSNENFLQRPQYLMRFLLIVSSFLVLFLKSQNYLHLGTLQAYYVVFSLWSASEVFPRWSENKKINFFPFMFQTILTVMLLTGLYYLWHFGGYYVLYYFVPRIAYALNEQAWGGVWYGGFIFLIIYAFERNSRAYQMNIESEEL